MDAETRSRALRAARKVAFGAAFVGALPGCGGKVEVDSPPLTPNSDGAGGSIAYPSSGGETTVVDAAVAETAVADAGVVGVAGAATTVDGLRCLAEVQLGTANPSTSTPVSDAQFACCATYDNQRIASQNDAGQASAVGSDPSFVNCCRAMIARGDSPAGTPPSVSFFPARDVCCFNGIVAPASELYAHQFCAPWGPPVPPALARELEISA